MTSLAGVRCPLCGGHLSAGGLTISLVQDAPSGFRVEHESACDECGRAYTVRVTLAATKVEVLDGETVLGVQALPRPAGGSDGATGMNTNL